MRIAVPTGRLEQPSWAWLNARGLCSGARRGRSLLWAPKPGLEVVVVRGRDIPQLLSRDAIDLAVLGRDLVEESEEDLSFGPGLGFGLCRLMLALPQGQAALDRRNWRIATRYPRITRAWAEQEGYQVDIVELAGSVEVAPRLGLADAVVDIVETGETLRANGLEPVTTVLESYAGLATKAGQRLWVERLGLNEEELGCAACEA